MPFTNSLPEWNKTATAPTLTKKNAGWSAGEKPPASIFDWFFNTTFKALQELQQEAVNVDQKGVNNGIATLDATGDLPIGQADNILNWVKGFGLGDSAKTVTGDINTLVINGFYKGSNLTNAPDDGFYLIIVNMWDSNTGAQIAVRPDGLMFVRGKSGSNGSTWVWGAWQQQETTTGAQTKATTAETNAKNASAPISHVGAGGSAHPAAVANGANGFITGADKAKLDGIASGAEVNQNAFSSVLVGGTTLDADNKTDILQILAGTGITITADAAADNFTIAVSTPTWTNVTLQNGAAAYAVGDEPKYTKLGNEVYIQGAVKGLTGTSTVVATLPAGFRPSQTIAFALPTTNVNGANFARWSISPAGAITMESISATGSTANTSWYPMTMSFVVA